MGSESHRPARKWGRPNQIEEPERTQIILPKKHLIALRGEAKAHDQSVSALIRQIIEDYLEAKDHA